MKPTSAFHETRLCTSVLRGLSLLALIASPACGGGGGGEGESSETSASSSSSSSSSSSTDTNSTSATDTNTTSATDTNTTSSTDTNTTSSTDTNTDSATDTNTDTDTDTATDTNNDDSSSDGSGGCDTGFACVPATPNGWAGPVILSENAGGGSPGCGGDYPNQVGNDVNTGLNSVPAECGCLCGDPTNVVCKGNLERTAPGDSACATVQQSAPITSDICSFVSLQDTEYAWLQDAFVDSAQCTGSSTENLPDPTWDAGANICGAADSEWAACDDEGECVPYDTRICVYRPGDLNDCPMGYPYEFLAFEDFVDDRACTSCTCAIDEDCTGTIQMHQSGGGLCNDPIPYTMDGTECFDTPSGGIQSVFWEIPDMTCSESIPSNPTGGVTASNGTTVCCTTES